jgi:hypothetical protein
MKNKLILLFPIIPIIIVGVTEYKLIPKPSIMMLSNDYGVCELKENIKEFLYK